MKTGRFGILIVAVAVCVGACGGSQPPTRPPAIVNPPVVTPPVMPPTLTVTKIMAFGDSLTEGESLGQLFAPTLHNHGTAGVATSYPFKLKTILASTYTGQADQIQVFNAGVGGEKVVGSQAKDRLLIALNTYQPQVLLLLHGVNNVNGPEPIGSIVEAIEELIELAHGRGVHVILGNLPPQRPSAKATGGPRIVQFNNELPAVASEEGATFVDVFSNISLDMLMPDGLHINETGNQKLAEVFYAAIKARYHREPGQ